MATKPPQELAQTLKSIETGSLRLNQLATEISQRIVAFEDWLNRLPGKTATTFWYDTSDDGAISFGLALNRDGKRWALWHVTCVEPTDEEDWSLLKEASVDVKLKVVSYFPAFLEAIVKAQAELAKELEKAHSEFDLFANAIGLTPMKEGK